LTIPFAELTYDEQLRRFTQAARESLVAYELAEADLQSILYENNAVFKVVSPIGEQYALRLHRPDNKRPEWIRSELMWLSAIRQHTVLQVPQPVKTVKGDWLTESFVEGLDKPMMCVLLGWLEGTFYEAEALTPDQMRLAGVFLAALHQFSATYVPPQDFIRPRLDWEGLFGEDSPYNPGNGARIFTPEQRAIFTEVDARVRVVMDELGQGGQTFGLIHADYLPQNILFSQQGAGAIDFDECAWGYYLYDLAPALWEFKLGSNSYDLMRDALLSGYSSRRPLAARDAGYLEAFIAARHLASCRWQAGHLDNPRLREEATEVIARRTEGLKRFLQTGSI
jgi:Ser/Thr protein kinase RdoA (MazF antagonist)